MAIYRLKDYRNKDFEIESVNDLKPIRKYLGIKEEMDRYDLKYHLEEESYGEAYYYLEVINEEIDDESLEALKKEAKYCKLKDMDETEFINYVGWQDWMNAYTTCTDDEMLTEADNNNINNFLKKIYKEVEL